MSEEDQRNERMETKEKRECVSQSQEAFSYDHYIDHSKITYYMQTTVSMIVMFSKSKVNK